MDYSCPYCRNSLAWRAPRVLSEKGREVAVCPFCSKQVVVNRHWGHYLAARMLFMIPAIPFIELFASGDLTTKWAAVVGLLALICLIIWMRVARKYRDERQYEEI